MGRGNPATTYGNTNNKDNNGHFKIAGGTSSKSLVEYYSKQARELQYMV
ncbi:MAG: hypothetical protein WBP64_19120 [Nitrososphaeraceae archaeon]|jgi:hypothetical protein